MFCKQCFRKWFPTHFSNCIYSLGLFTGTLFFFFFNWSLITLQYCSGFCHTLTWISHGFTWTRNSPPSPVGRVVLPAHLSEVCQVICLALTSERNVSLLRKSCKIHILFSVGISCPDRAFIGFVWLAFLTNNNKQCLFSVNTQRTCSLSEK